MTCALERISVIDDRESLSEAAEADILVDVAWKANEKQKRLTTGPPNVKCYCRGSWVGFSLKLKLELIMYVTCALEKILVMGNYWARKVT